MVLRYQTQLGVTSGNKNPAVETVAACKTQQESQRALVAGAGPVVVTGDVARIFRNPMIIADEADGNSTSPERARKGEAAVGAANDQGADGPIERHIRCRSSSHW